MAIEDKTLEDMCLILKRLTSSFNDLFDMSYNGSKAIKIELKKRELKGYLSIYLKCTLFERKKKKGIKIII